MDKLKLAHDWYMKHSENSSFMYADVKQAWQYADAMQAEAEKRKKAEAEQKRKEIREMLNAPNTFVEREGQHFDDVEEWQPDWSQAPDGYNWFCVGGCSGVGYFCKIEPVIYKDHYWFVGEDTKKFTDHGYQGNWQDSLRERPHCMKDGGWKWGR